MESTTGQKNYLHHSPIEMKGAHGIFRTEDGVGLIMRRVGYFRMPLRGCWALVRGSARQTGWDGVMDVSGSG